MNATERIQAAHEQIRHARAAMNILSRDENRDTLSRKAAQLFMLLSAACLQILQWAAAQGDICLDNTEDTRHIHGV